MAFSRRKVKNKLAFIKDKCDKCGNDKIKSTMTMFQCTKCKFTKYKDKPKEVESNDSRQEKI